MGRLNGESSTAEAHTIHPALQLRPTPSTLLCKRTEAGSQEGKSVPGSPYNISKNDEGFQHAVLTATDSFNNQSNDAFLFRPSAIDGAQRQIIKGIRYIAEVQISRTVCYKRETPRDLSRCDFQPDGRLQQVSPC
ncbi:cystatin [Diretmus argenteus]